MQTTAKMIHRSNAQWLRTATRDKELADLCDIEPIDINKAMLDAFRAQGIIGPLTRDDAKSTNKHIH